MSDYLDGTAEQAVDRNKSYIRDLDSYFELRRKTIGVLSSFNMLEMDTEIPDEALEHPVIVELLSLAVDLTIIANVSPLHAPWALDRRGNYSTFSSPIADHYLRTSYRTTKNRLQGMTNTISSQSSW